MKVIKIIVYAILALVALFFVIAVVLPSEYRVERSVQVACPDSVVFQQVLHYENWVKWSPWQEMEPDAKNSFPPPDSSGMVGATWHWEGEKIGVGSLTLREVVPNRKIVSDLAFVKPYESAADDIWNFEALPEGGTRITWLSQGPLSYPLERYMGLFMDGTFLGPPMEKGLAKLKQICETVRETIEERP